MFLSQLRPIAGEHSSIYLSRESFGEGAGYAVFPSQFRRFHLWTCKENFGKNVSEVFPWEKLSLFLLEEKSEFSNHKANIRAWRQVYVALWVTASCIREKSGLKHCHIGEWPKAPLLQEALVTFSHVVPTSACLHQTHQTPQPDSQVLWEPPFSTISSLKNKADAVGIFLLHQTVVKFSDVKSHRTP